MNTTPTPADLFAWGYHLVPWHRNPRIPALKDYLNPDTQRLIPGYLKMSTMDWAILPTNGVVCLDLEMKGGLNGLMDLDIIDHTIRGMHCPTTRTKSNGFHLWFRDPSNELIGGPNIRIAPGIECKAKTGTCHIPPSVGYTAVMPLFHPEALPVLPDSLAALWRQAMDNRPRQRTDTAVVTVPNGERRQFALSVAGTLRNRLACNADEIAALLRAMRDRRFDDAASFTDDEVALIAKDIATKEIDGIEGLALAGDTLANSVLRLTALASKRTK